MRNQAIDLEIFAKKMSDKELLYKTYKELQKSTIRKQTTALKMAKDLDRCFSKCRYTYGK